jgi:SAM-dependent methyltransferase
MILEAAGIGSGMRVLDLGSGMGDVAFIVAELVKSTGEVLGIDRAQEPVAEANLRAEQQGFGNVRFVVGDIHNAAPDGPFDAIVGRLVLMHVADPAAVLRAQSALLGSGGVVVPIEFDLDSARSLPSTPLVGKALSWLHEAYARSSIAPALGPRLWTVLKEAGLRPMGMIGVQPHFGPHDPDGPTILAGIIRTALPLLQRTAVATAEEVGPDTLQQRLTDELANAGAIFAHPMLFGVWATIDRTP